MGFVLGEENKKTVWRNLTFVRYHWWGKKATFHITLVHFDSLASKMEKRIFRPAFVLSTSES